MPEIMNWPTEWCADADTSFRLRSNSLFSPGSLLAAAPNIYGPQAQVFTASIAVAQQRRREWQRIDAFFGRLAGISGLIRMFDPKRIRPGRDIVDDATAQLFSDGTHFSDGTAWEERTIPPFVTLDESAAAGADSIVLRGLPVSLSPCLWADDLMEIRPNGIPSITGHLYQAAFDAPTNAAGKTRVTITPALRQGASAGDMVVLDHATSVFRAIDDEQGVLAHALGGTATTGFALIEVLP